MSSDTRHPQYDDATLLAAIEAALQEMRQAYATTIGNTLLCHPLGRPGLCWPAEAPARLALARALLALLPEPTPPVVDGKTPGQVAWDAGNEVQKRKFPNEPVMSWEEGEELHEQLEAAASAVLAAFGGQPASHEASVGINGLTASEEAKTASVAGLSQTAEIPWTEWHADEPTPEPDQPSAQPWQPAVGEPVRLVSGGPAMTVGEINSDGIGCDWFDEFGQWHGMMFKPACLVSAKEAQP